MLRAVSSTPWQYNMSGCRHSSIILLQPMFICENLIHLIIQQIIPFPPTFLVIQLIVMLKLNSILNEDSIV